MLGKFHIPYELQGAFHIFSGVGGKNGDNGKIIKRDLIGYTVMCKCKVKPVKQNKKLSKVACQAAKFSNKTTEKRDSRIE